MFLSLVALNQEIIKQTNTKIIKKQVLKTKNVNSFSQQLFPFEEPRFPHFLPHIGQPMHMRLSSLRVICRPAKV